MHGPHAASAPAYNVQIAGDSEHALVVAHQVTTEANDKRSLLPRAEAKVALGNPAELHAVADAGYANAEQAEQCERQGIVSHVPVQRTVNNQGDGSALDRSQFTSDALGDRFHCPAGQTLERKGIKKERSRILYQATAQACGACLLKNRCRQARWRTVYRHLHEAALERMGQRATRRPCVCDAVVRSTLLPA